MAPNEVEAEQSDRHIDEKHCAPMQVGGDQATGDGTDHGADQARDGDEAHGLDQVGLVVGARERHAADRRHHGAAGALQDAAGNQRVDVRREAAKYRPESEQPDRRGEDGARAEPVGHPAADRNEDGEAQRIARQHRFHAERRHIHRPGNGGHGRVQDRGVERLHEERHRDQPRQQPLDVVARFGERRRGHVSVRRLAAILVHHCGREPGQFNGD